MNLYNPTQLQSYLNGQKAAQARRYVDDQLSEIYQAPVEDLGPNDKAAAKREFNFTMETIQGPWRDVKITINIAHAPAKISPAARTEQKADPRQSRFDISQHQEEPTEAEALMTKRLSEEDLPDASLDDINDEAEYNMELIKEIFEGTSDTEADIPPSTNEDESATEETADGEEDQP